MKKPILFLLASLLLVAIIFPACSSPEKPATTQPTASANTPAANLKVLKLGNLYNGKDPSNLQVKKWYELLAKLTANAGGWKIGNETYQVEWTFYDTQASASAAKDSLSKLVLQDNIKFIFGGTGSSAVDVTITEPNKAIMFAYDLTNNSAQPNVNYFFSTGAFFTNALVYKICKDVTSKGIKTYVSVKPDTEMGRAIDPVIDGSWKLANPDVKKLGTVFVEAGTIDYGTVATKIKSYNPDCVDLIYLGMINGVTPTYRSLADIGYKGVILPGLLSADDLANLVTMVGKDVVEGGEVASFDPRGYQKDPRMLSLVDAFIKEYGKLDTSSIQAIAAYFLFEDAVNSAQTLDVEKVKYNLENCKKPVRTMPGFIQLFARPDLGNLRTVSGATSNPVVKIHDGKMEYATQVTLKDQYLFPIIANRLGDKYKEYWDKYGYPVFPEEEKNLASLHFSDLGISGKD